MSEDEVPISEHYDKFRDHKGFLGGGESIPLLCRAPTCPSCNHELDADEMNGQVADLWALAPDEGRTHIVCPGCHVTYHCQGGYVPTYATALNEDDL